MPSCTLRVVRIDVWDTVFVRARRVDIHPFMADVEGYPRWWPDLRAEAAASALYRVTHQAHDRLGRRHEVTVRVEKVRPDKGIVFAYEGDIAGKAEFFYLDEVDGVAVHYLLGAEVEGRGWRRRLAAHRASVRAALNRLKDICEHPRLPGEEPDPALLAHQERAAADLLPADGRHRTDAIREQP